ncbi:MULTISPECIES: universal stress protein [Halocynthiibacter]|uniref:Universal stress protein n=1 Tax=Halocynthiibacter halioticoli TaxID=2986804 RepID=A0AAE3IY99_9RHOB|nr:MULTISPECIES: universal stress protein [Halocynthiibacter]MCV6823340.1 universal stress protein [Halocynthiibacter halioticoli]MCW4056341.1 universal stress protein [Halocynthiibacter sp. SDUM655004]MDE0590693.1 universal stress protein [Halocynthiibacter sp. C4]
MSYKSILCIASAPATCAAALDYACALANQNEAHLDVLNLGVDRTQTGYYYAGANALIQQETIERASADAKEVDEWARKRLEGETFPWAAEQAVVQISGLNRVAAHRARFADAVVLPKPYGEARDSVDEGLVEAALFEGNAPIIVVPDAPKALGAPKNVVIGWNESVEALNAVRAAMPFLLEADQVNIAVIDPPTHGPNRSDPGGLLSQLLSRHGIHAEISVLAKSMPRVGDIMLRHISDQNADMLVMGAYGHSRFREAVLGGATRYMLENAEVPVFMRH